MNKVNYQKKLDIIISEIQNTKIKKKVMLHSCCAPCSSYVLSYLAPFFDITVLYYNPNITDKDEYEKRKKEQIRLISELLAENPDYSIDIADCDYDADTFFSMAKGLENCREGGERCFKCYTLRLNKAAEAAARGGYDYFCTTLTISPLKNTEKINEIGNQLSEKHGVSFLPSDFKKKEGFKQSIELSKKYKLYRQNYCGCIYSK